MKIATLNDERLLTVCDRTSGISQLFTDFNGLLFQTLERPKNQ